LSESSVNLYLYGETNQQYGRAVTSGNLNGDLQGGRPLDDIIVAPYVSGGQGPVKMIFGSSTISGTKRLSVDANWTSAYNLAPRNPNLTTGDFNRDGISDLLAADAGRWLYMNYGSATTISSQADVEITDSSEPDDYRGFSNFISDFDGNGIKDLAFLAPRWHGGYINPVGRAIILWGQTMPLPPVIDIATESTHFTLYGSDGTGPTGLASNCQGSWNSTYGYVFGMELEGAGSDAELFFGGTPYGFSQHKKTYIYHIGPRQQGGGGCFLVGTPILMADHTTRPIEKVKVGELILAFDETTKTLKEDKVKEFFEHDADEYLIVNGTLRVTANHPVYSNGKWTEIGKLKIGDTLLNAKGKEEPITSIQKIREKAKVYNLEVNPYHTYIAGGIVVHNKKMPMQAEDKGN